MPRPNQDGLTSRLRHPDTKMAVTLDPTVEYDDSDPLVRAFPWAFDGVKTKVTRRTRDEKAAK
jgi:hypothetical protein